MQPVFDWRTVINVARRISVKTIAVTAWFLILFIISLLVSCQRQRVIDKKPEAASPAGPDIRVLLFDNIRECTLTSGSELKLRDPVTGYEALMPSRKEFKIRFLDGKVLAGSRLFADTVEIAPLEDIPVAFDGKYFRGSFIISAARQDEGFSVVSHVPMEWYLAGVIGAEMPSYWEKEALKAQAVASRTYALFISRRFGPNRDYDVKRTQANQVYNGVEAENPRVWEAVESTSGRVLQFYDGGRWEIFPTYFHSSSGGHTENSDKVFGGDSYPTLQGVDSPYCEKVTRSSLFNWKPVEFSRSYVTRRLFDRYPSLQKLGSVKDIRVRDKSDYDGFSRMTMVRIIGENGKEDFLRGEDLRLAVDPTGRKIKSAACEVKLEGDMFRFYNGHGFGHGVGMSQYGALGLARQGATAAQILEHYYPGSRIERLY